jgi:hypothetical protein
MTVTETNLPVTVTVVVVAMSNLTVTLAMTVSVIMTAIVTTSVSMSADTETTAAVRHLPVTGPGSVSSNVRKAPEVGGRLFVSLCSDNIIALGCAREPSDVGLKNHAVTTK